MIEILRAKTHRHMPWKNGGGVTVEIAIHPAGATVDDFDWRISTATVAQDGAFSVFPGIDRTLSVLEGNGIILSVDGTETRLTQISAPYGFAADAATNARLIDGAIIDLNIMTRRGLYAHAVKRIVLDHQTIHMAVNGDNYLFIASGFMRLKCAEQEEDLQAKDCAVLHAQQDLSVKLTGQAIAYLINFKRV